MATRRECETSSDECEEVGHIAKTCPLKAAAGKKKHPFKSTSKKAVPQAPATEAQSNHDNAHQDQVADNEQADENATHEHIVDDGQANNHGPKDQGTHDELGLASFKGW